MPASRPHPSVLGAWLGGVLALMLLPSAAAAEGTAAALDWAQHRQGPKASASVYWVGHSLVEHKSATTEGVLDLMSLVGSFAKAKGLGYEIGDHTLWGASLSALWRGRPHAYDRDASLMVEKRKRFQSGEAAKYDTLVLTDGVPVSKAIEYEYSPYYVRQFYCTIKTANPASRVYLYENWVNIDGPEDQAGQFDWRQVMRAERTSWEQLAEAARQPRVKRPSWRSHIWPAISDGGCGVTDPIFIIPVGQALLALAERLDRPRPGDRFELAGGQRLAMTDLVENAYVKEAGTPPEDASAQNKAPILRDPAKPHDDIHLSAIGIYFVSLVHFATIYRQSPIGLPPLEVLGEATARTLTCIAWETVVADPRAGVEPNGGC